MARILAVAILVSAILLSVTGQEIDAGGDEKGEEQTPCTTWRLNFELTREEACMDRRLLGRSLRNQIRKKLQTLAPTNFIDMYQEAFFRHVESSVCSQTDQTSLDTVRGTAEMLLSFSFERCDISEIIIVLQRLVELDSVRSATFISLADDAKLDGVVEAMGKDPGDQDQTDAAEKSEHLKRLHRILFIGLVVSCAILVLIVANYARTTIVPKLIPSAAARNQQRYPGIQLPIASSDVSTLERQQPGELDNGSIRISIDADVGYHSPRHNSNATATGELGVYRARIHLDSGRESRLSHGSFAARLRSTPSAASSEEPPDDNGEVGGSGSRSDVAPAEPFRSPPAVGTKDVTLSVNLRVQDPAAERAAGMIREAARQGKGTGAAGTGSDCSPLFGAEGASDEGSSFGGGRQNPRFAVPLLPKLLRRGATETPG